MCKAPHMATIRETAKETGLPEHFIRRLCKTGKIVTVMAGNRCLINVDRLIDYLNNPNMEEAQA